eukprot:m.147343 g.147343  ORF g.147343 m.147343 type:complete len:238 (-) comp16826_c0_seq1:1853-2566(-)
MEADSLVYRAKLADQMGRHKEMAQLIYQLAQNNKSLNIDERNLLSVAYKHVVGSQRNAWRVVSAIEAKEAARGGGETRKLACARTYKEKIAKEVNDTCNELLGLLNEELLPQSRQAEERVFYLKLKADYYRYLSEVLTGTDRDEVVESALLAYKEADSIAHKELPPTHPVRLGVSLNQSVFFFETLNSSDRACETARTAYNLAVDELNRLSEKEFQDSAVVLQLLRENLKQWEGDLQ